MLNIIRVIIFLGCDYMKKEIIITILYLLSTVNYFTYIATKQSAFMFSGGVLLIAASTMLIINNINKKK